jgi:hypothetical protein
VAKIPRDGAAVANSGAINDDSATALSPWDARPRKLRRVWALYPLGFMFILIRLLEKIIV